MTTTEAGSDGPEATERGGIDRLNAFDGLFLRAEHLNRIQDYALELATALGTAVGPGVAEGFDVTSADGELHVGAGLAVDAYGRPLRSERLVSLPLAGLKPGTNTFWWVEVTSHALEYGDEAVQGTLCDQPCANGSTRHPYTAEGVRIGLREDTEPGLEQQPAKDRRAWLASRRFEAERAEVPSWPGAPGEPEGHLLPRGWDPPPAPATRPTGVRLAVLIPVGASTAEWEVDVWTARRDRGETPPEGHWRSRLGMRPWGEFTAQVLQFQALLADRLAKLPRPSGTDLRAELVGRLDELRKVRTRAGMADRAAKLMEQLTEGAEAWAATPAPTPLALADLGIHELPPAGYLPCTSVSVEPLVREIELLLGLDSDRLGFCVCEPGDVGQAVQEAQHRERIPLGPDSRAAVDILVPLAQNGQELAGSWVAFVRRDRRSCFQPGRAVG